MRRQQTRAGGVFLFCALSREPNGSGGFLKSHFSAEKVLPKMTYRNELGCEEEGMLCEKQSAFLELKLQRKKGEMRSLQK